MKVLFITHSGNFVYGAARSLGLLLANIKKSDFEYDVMFDKRILRHIPMEDIKQHAGSNCGKIMFAYYPSDFHCLEAESILQDLKVSVYHTLRGFVGTFLNAVRAYMNRDYLNQVINDKQYDLVVLNSFVLYNLLGSSTPTILYVRCLASKHLRYGIMDKVNSATGIICIEKTVEEYLLFHKDLDTNIPRIVLYNPFDMSTVKDVDAQKIRENYGIDKDQTVFVIAGVITKSKGVDFIVEAFDKVQRQDAVLLVVGEVNPKNNLSMMLTQKYSSNKNIKFIGEVLKMEEIYAITDYLLRGETTFGTGRTVYEALYSGCGVLLQGSEENLGEFTEFPNYKQRINFYVPRNVKSLAGQFQKLEKIDKTVAEYSNMDHYMKTFISFAKSIARKSGEPSC